MKAVTIVDRVFASLPPISGTADDQPLPAEGRENLAHYLMGTQEPWYGRAGLRADFLLRQGFLSAHRVQVDQPSGQPAVDKWRAQVRSAQERAQAMLHDEPSTDEDQRQLAWFSERTRRFESPAQIQQRVWLAQVMFSLGLRGLRFNEEGVIFTDGAAFGAQIGGEPDLILQMAHERHAQCFYVATFALRLVEDPERDYPVEIDRGRGRRRWYVHEMRLDPQVGPLFEIEPAPVQRNIALVVAGDERATRAALPRDYYRDPAFQQAVIDAEDGKFDATFVLSPRHHVVALDQMVEDDVAWDNLDWSSRWGSTMKWAQVTHSQLWCLVLAHKTPLPAKLVERLNQEGRVPAWAVWRHPESRYTFTIFGQSDASRMLTYTLSSHARVQSLPGYLQGDLWDEPPGFWQGRNYDDFDLEEVLDDLDLGEDVEQDLRDTFLNAAEEAAQLSQLLYLFPPPTLRLPPRQLSPDEALEPIMLLRTRDCDVEQVVDELSDLQELVDGELVNFNVLIDAPTRLTAVLRIIHATLHGDESEVASLSEQVLPSTLHELVVNPKSRPLEERLCSLLAFAEALSSLTVLLNDDDRDRLSVWQRTYWASEMRRGGSPADNGGAYS